MAANNLIKKIIKNSLYNIALLSNRTKIGRIYNNIVLEVLRNSVKEITYKNINIKLSAPNLLCLWRAETFAIKEPETLDWIDSLPDEAVFWDIGANVGLYSIYAGKKKNMKIWAFEPSVFNLELLARNVYMNKLTENICILPFALSDVTKKSIMRHTSTDLGGALSTFDKTFGWDGKYINEIFDYQIYGMKIDDLINMLSIPVPDYIKIDVDGLEHYILKGGIEHLCKVKGILIEINDDFIEQARDCERILSDAGFKMINKLQSDISASSTAGFKNTYNQIWARYN